MFSTMTAIVFTTFIMSTSAYDIVKDYSGQNFFSGWNFYGNWDNTTFGNVTYVDQQTAFSQQLAYTNGAGNAVLKVDNTTNVQYGQLRNSVRITSQASYGVGSLWIIDALHVPYGCSVWPAFWTVGPTWPDDGEIDIVEGINVQSNNQMALHSTQGCYHSSDASESGTTGETDCSTAAGCVVYETKPNSYESGFAAAGGGVWATQFDVSGVYMWFWSREDVPASIVYANSTSSITDLSQWGTPSASYPVDACNISQFFTAQQLVLNIDLCGDWAAIPQFYDPTCGNQGSTGICYDDCVVGPGSPRYDNAYWEISYLRAYTTGGAAPTATSGGGQLAGGSGGSPAPTSSEVVAPAANAAKEVGQYVPVGGVLGVVAGVVLGGWSVLW